MAKKITKKDRQKITKLFEDGKDLQAENFFVNKYIIKPAQKMQTFVSNLISRIEGKILSTKQMHDLTFTVSNTIATYDSDLSRLYSQYSNMFSRFLFKKYEIRTPFVKNTIKESSIALFKQKTQGALSRTNADLLQDVRKYQMDLIKARQKIDRQADVGRILQKDVQAQFEKQVKSVNRLNKNLFKKRLGNAVVYRDGSVHSFEEYTEMATRTTVLNVDRTSVEVKSGVTGRRVVEYYLRDKRVPKVKGPKGRRAVCHSIMNTKIKGVSMVALDQEAADILGIRTLEQAKAEDGHAFGPNCRHSIKPLSDALYNELEKLFFVVEGKGEVA